MSASVEVGLVGLGTIAQTHLSVLAERPKVEVCWAVDPDRSRNLTFKERPVPRFGRASEALGEHQPDVVVVMSPTDTHASLAREVLTQSAARLLVEKPLVHDLEALRPLRRLGSTVDLGSRLFVAHHFAFSPEVRWGADVLRAHPEWGPVTRITSSFHDPYIVDASHSFAAYVSSWVDSGVNQLSMLARFVDLVGRGPLHESGGGATSWCQASYESDGFGGSALLHTSWQATASSKRTTLVCGRSGVEVWLDHTAVTGFVVADGQVEQTLLNDGRTPRKLAHYRPLYESFLSEVPDPILGFETAATIVEMLYDERSD